MGPATKSAAQRVDFPGSVEEIQALEIKRSEVMHAFFAAVSEAGMHTFPGRKTAAHDAFGVALAQMRQDPVLEPLFRFFYEDRGTGRFHALSQAIHSCIVSGILQFDGDEYFIALSPGDRRHVLSQWGSSEECLRSAGRRFRKEVRDRVW